MKKTTKTTKTTKKSKLPFKKGKTPLGMQIQKFATQSKGLGA